LNKARRLFACLRGYTDWQKTWIAQVKTNFARQKMKSSFRDIYLNTVLQRIQRRKMAALAAKVIREI